MLGRIAILAAVTIVATSAPADPLDEPIVGPKRICFKYSTFQLDEGERITDFSAFPEAMSITVQAPSNRFKIGESELFGAGKRAGYPLWSNQGTTVYRASRHHGYFIYGRTRFSAGKGVAVVWLYDQARTGGKIDAAIYRRVQVRDPTGLKCDRGFTYSWGVDLGTDGS